MSDLSITGKLITKEDTQQVSDRFKKRIFVLKLSENINGNVYTNFAKMQLVQNKCDILDRYSIGDEVIAKFNIKGNKWERDGKVDYISSLDCWSLSYANAATQTYNAASDTPKVNPIDEADSNLPF